jgi:hypothetical protein
MLAAIKCERNSIGIELIEEYCRMALNRLKAENQDLFRKDIIEYARADGNGGNLVVAEEKAGYKPGKKPARGKKKPGKK